MTQWQPFDLRIPGQPWPGVDTLGGRLDNGAGQLTDRSTNVEINRADVLAKRKGFVRGLAKRYSGPVCGLFTYVDECGREFLLVADQEAISIESPFTIPVFEQDDAYPFDDFSEALDTSRWSNTTDYETNLGRLRLAATALVSDGSVIPPSRFMQWFKEASATSYFTQIQYDFDNDVDQNQGICSVIKRDTAGTTFIRANLFYNNTSPTAYRVSLEHVTPTKTTTLVESADLAGVEFGSGFLRLQYNALTRVASFTVIPTGGSAVSGDSDPLTELQDTALGQNTAVGVAFFTGGVRAQQGILTISGGPL